MKNALLPVKLIDAASMGASITSETLHTQFFDNIGLQLDWSGSPVGTIEVQVSLNHTTNPDGTPKAPGTWVTLPSSAFVGTYPVPGTTASPAFLEIPLSASAYIRVVYTRSSGTGTLTVLATGKGV